ncbi:hypothetical protein BJ138DRAFT_1118470 [Hygrophoropsis aurantiaca]|uniref:Uncharacterized protein n=1 Tax=Hygrophoropsis aurantiaca TaxID=72124 RepID=A0ACB7ZW34_9AGAM|nr:hypothetical protein BJ138DRAFT_1118470 [Hygrophoropsis aurantiaca]
MTPKKSNKRSTLAGKLRKRMLDARRGVRADKPSGRKTERGKSKVDLSSNQVFVTAAPRLPKSDSVAEVEHDDLENVSAYPGNMVLVARKSGSNRGAKAKNIQRSFSDDDYVESDASVINSDDEEEMATNSATSGSNSSAEDADAGSKATGSAVSSSDREWETFEGFGPLPAEEVDVGTSDVADSDHEQSADVVTQSNKSIEADSEDVKADDDDHRPLAIRKSKRSRKATEKVVALENKKKSTPSEWEESDAERVTTAYFEDAMVTSSVAPEEDMTVVARDKMLNNTYQDLVPLRPVVLTCKGISGETVMISKWLKTSGARINKQFVIALVSFKSHDVFVNLSRIDPALLTTKAIGKNSYVSFAQSLGSQLAMCLSVIVVVESCIGHPGRTPSGGGRKEITGYFLAQEFERFAGVAGAVFGHQHFWTQTNDSAFNFGTFVRNDGDKSKFSAPAPARPQTAGMFSSTPSPSSATGNRVRAVLASDSYIPLYDYRSEKTFNPDIHLNPALYAKALPSTDDLPPCSLALVAYTTTKFTLTTGNPGLGCNLMWAALLSNPPLAKEEKGARPVSPRKQKPANSVPVTSTKPSAASPAKFNSYLLTL